jgi:endogenous inhibitor of DNA gyrase (YacG/DUF329 family)
MLFLHYEDKGHINLLVEIRGLDARAIIVAVSLSGALAVLFYTWTAWPEISKWIDALKKKYAETEVVLDYVICPSCTKIYCGTEDEALKCPFCQKRLEDIDRYYERNPEEKPGEAEQEAGRKEERFSYDRPANDTSEFTQYTTFHVITSMLSIFILVGLAILFCCA